MLGMWGLDTSTAGRNEQSENNAIMYNRQKVDLTDRTHSRLGKSDCKPIEQ